MLFVVYVILFIKQLDAKHNNEATTPEITVLQEITLCRPDLCPPETTSLGCLDPEIFSDECGNDNRMIRVNGMLRQGILKNVNILRNFVASGFGNLSIAARMPTMKWDYVLEYLAIVSVHQCKSDEQYCANTEPFHYVATIQMTSLKKRHSSLFKHVTQKLLPTWFSDILGCRMDADENIQPAAEGGCVGHFVPLIEDNGDSMGCAIRIQSIPNNNTEILKLFCHFSRANVNKMRPYEIGNVPGEKCESGKNRLYRFLCDRSHIVHANTVTTNDSEEN